jgi:hypothetical protein
MGTEFFRFLLVPMTDVCKESCDSSSFVIKRWFLQAVLLNTRHVQYWPLTDQLTGTGCLVIFLGSF